MRVIDDNFLCYGQASQNNEFYVILKNRSNNERVYAETTPKCTSKKIEEMSETKKWKVQGKNTHKNKHNIYQNTWSKKNESTLIKQENFPSDKATTISICISSMTMIAIVFWQNPYQRKRQKQKNALLKKLATVLLWCICSKYSQG